MNRSLRRPVRRHRRARAGFTLLEVMLVLAILVVLGGTVTLYFSGMREGANIDIARSQMATIKQAVDLYQLHTGQYPSSLESLIHQPADLTDANRWKGPYLDSDSVPNDPWGQPYNFQITQGQGSGTRNLVQLYSAGPDMAPNTEDDVKL